MAELRHTCIILPSDVFAPGILPPDLFLFLLLIQPAHVASVSTRVAQQPPLPFWSQHAEPSDPGSAGGKQRTGGTGLGNAALGVKRRAVQKPMLKHKATADWQKFLKKGKKKL